MEIEITTQIKTAYAALSKSEQKVADFILENLEKIIYISVSEVAIACNVGEATVLRFCKKVGYNGFQGFKKKIIDIIEKEREAGQKRVENEVFDEMSVMLNHTLKIQNVESLKRIAKLIKKANNIYIFGLGLSNLSAKAAEIRLSFLGYSAISLGETHIQLVKANLVKKNDLVIGLSVSGETKDTVKNIKIAKEAGASIVGITNYNPSSIANMSDEIVLSASREVVDSGTTLVTLTSQLFIIEEICSELMKIDKERIDKHTKKIMGNYD